MSDPEKFGLRLAKAIERHPGRAKFIAWSITAVIVLAGGWAIWRQLSQGEYIKFAVVGAIAVFGGIKAYRVAKNAQRTSSTKRV